MFTTSTPMSAGVGQRVHARLQEEVARILPGAEVHQLDLGGDARHAEPVDRRGDRARDVRAVAVLVHVGRIDARLVRARPRTAPSISGMSVVKLRLSDRLKFGRDVRVRPVDAGVDDPHAHAVVPRWRWYDSAGVARSACMSHCRSANGSAAGGGAACRRTRPLPAAPGAEAAHALDREGVAQGREAGA